MTLFREELVKYLTFRRVRGFKLKGEARNIEDFVAYLERNGLTFLTVEACSQWNDSKPATRAQKQRRVIAVRGFAAWLRSIDPRHQVPPNYRGQLGKNRPRPYIFSGDELQALVDWSGKIASRNGVRRLTYAVLWPFLFITGLRIGEALALDMNAFDFSKGFIRVQPQKGGYERLVPLHPSTVEELKAYARRRNRLLGVQVHWFFASEDGLRLKGDTTRQAFAEICKHAGLRPRNLERRDGRGPRIHDLRHTFAVNTLIAWYRDGKNVDDHILTLVDVLGHTSLEKTYWYLEAVPELLDVATRRVRPLEIIGGDDEA